MENDKRPEFPLVAFPKEFQELIINYEGSKNFDRNIQALAYLVHTASIIEMGTQFWIAGFNQPPIIWGNIIQPSGRAKSHLMRHCLSYLNEKNDELHTDSNVIHTYVTNNTTIEGLFKKHIGNRKGVTMFKDELPAFVKGINNYQSGGAKEEWMNAWNGGSQTLTRSEKNFHSTDVKPNVFGGSQPEKVHFLFDAESLADGFSARFLHTEPYIAKKQKKPKLKMNNEKLNFFHKIKHEPIWELPARTYYATEKGDEIWREWCDERDEQYEGYPQYEAYQSKLESYAIRIAGILHIMSYNKSDEILSGTIPDTAVENATKICDYFMGQFGRMLDNLSMHRFPDKLSEVLKNKRPEFQRIYSKLNGEHYSFSDIVNIFAVSYTHLTLPTKRIV